jgi:hypothetical protein
MDASHTFVFGNAHERDALWVRSDDGEKVDYDLLSGKWLPSQSIVFLTHQGRIPKDLIPSSDLWAVLISDKFRDSLVAHRFSGWHTYSAEVYGANGKLLRGYSGLSITGRSGKIDEAKSQVVEEGRYPTGRLRRMKQGLIFPPESWDGSDIFLAGDWGFIFCTERVAEVLRLANLTNVRLTRASEYRYPFVATERGDTKS